MRKLKLRIGVRSICANASFAAGINLLRQWQFVRLRHTRTLNSRHIWIRPDVPGSALSTILGTISYKDNLLIFVSIFLATKMKKKKTCLNFK